MWINQFRLTRLVASCLSGRRGSAHTKPRRHIPLALEQLEDRTVPAVFTPSTFVDGVGINSLRDAITQTDHNNQNNTIQLSSGNYELSLTGVDGAAANSGDLNLTAAGFTETIEGAGAGATLINANAIDRVFQIESNVTVVLQNLTVTGGFATDSGFVGGGDALGGGILNNGGNLTLDHVLVTGNNARGNPGQNARGGGVYSNGGSLTLSNSTITSNSALGGAGAAGVTGADGGNGGDAQGGGLYISGGQLTITASAIVNNHVRGGDGGRGGNGAPGVAATGPNYTSGPVSTGGANTAGPGPVSTGGANTAGPGPVSTGGNYGNTAAPGPVYTGGNYGNTAGPVATAGPAPVWTNGPGPVYTGGGGNTAGPVATAGPAPVWTNGPGPVYTGGGGNTAGPGPVGTAGPAPVWTNGPGPVYTGGGGYTGGAPAPTGGAPAGTGGAPAGSSGGGSLRAAVPAGNGGLGGIGGRGQGGGLYVSVGTIQIQTTTVTNNSAQAGNGGNGGNGELGGDGGDGGLTEGGGLFVAMGTVDFLNSNLSANVIYQSAGGLAGGSVSGSAANGTAPPDQGPDLFVASGTFNTGTPTSGGTTQNPGSANSTTPVSTPTTGKTTTPANPTTPVSPSAPVNTPAPVTSTVSVNNALSDKIGVVRPDGNGSLVFSLNDTGNGQFGAGDQVFHFGLPGDTIIVGDWNGHGKDEIGVERPDGNGSLVFTLDTNGDGVFDAGDQVFHFGLPGDTVIVGDWNGHGKDEIGVVRPDGNGSLLFTLDTNGDGVFGPGDQVFHFGYASDQVIVGDWNGAGKDEIGVVRPNGHGSLAFSLDTNGDGVFDAGDQVYNFGIIGDHPIVGDWSGAGKDEIGVYRTDLPHGSLAFALDTNDDGVFDAGDQSFDYGLPGDTVIVGNWTATGQDLQAATALNQSNTRPQTLTNALLAPIVNEATNIWIATGLNAQQIQALRQETVTIGPLRNGLLGYTVGESITISPNADGYGWYVDPTPANNEEFPIRTTIGLQALPGTAPTGLMDLLTAVVHEEGHVLGLPDLNPATYPNDIMTQTLPTGTRRLPQVGEIANFPGRS